MNKIEIIISGNLTGFSRFYASPGANEIYNEAKFDFDYRNFLTFLNNEEKAYAISFAPTVVSISLVTRILDSFRRPGILVVTILQPRNKKVVSVTNSQNEKALYQLLNAIYDTFRNKNFLNGMVNQNASVLTQDYYSDILSNYTLATDSLKHSVNSRIDTSSPNKKLGYVKSVESNMPLYLSTPYRKSYEGYHHVFFSENAPQNIEEEPEEVILYDVLVCNNNQRLRAVRKTDRIFNLRPEEGEIDINKDFTYQQVLEGEAGRDICAFIEDETINITYNFPKETKEIHFTFTDNGNPVPFSSISPIVIFSNGERLHINNENWTFEGKEIYDGKTIESGNRNIIVKQESSRLDIRRLKNGQNCQVLVEQCFPLRILFENQFIKSKRLKLFRSNDVPFLYDVEDSLSVRLPGRPEEYSYVIESNYYETVRGKLPSDVSDLRINLTPKVENNRDDIYRTNTQIPSKETGVVVRRTTKETNTGGMLKLEGNPSVFPNTPKKKNNKTIIALASTFIVFVALVVLGVVYVDDVRKFCSNLFENSGEDVIKAPETEKIFSKSIIISFLDSDGYVVKSKDFKSFSNLVQIEVDPNEFVKKVEPEESDIFYFKYSVEFHKSEIKPISFKVVFGEDGKDIISNVMIFKVEELCSNSDRISQNLSLNIRTSEIKLYKDLSEKYADKKTITKKQRKEYQARINRVGSSTIKEKLNRLLSDLSEDPGNGSSSSNTGTDGKSESGGVENNNNYKNENIDDPVSTEELPKPIIKAINGPGLINPKDIADCQDQEHKKILQNYNIWFQSVYSNKDNSQKEVIKKELKKVNKFSELKTITNKYKKRNENN